MTATDQSGRVDHVDASTLGEPPRLRMPGALVRALRPKQWLKNVLVFAAPVAAGVIREDDVLLETAGAFAAFCLVSSGTYLVNDAVDVESDRRHPTKRHRPIASGAVPLGLAPWTPGLVLWVLFPAFSIVGYVLFVIGARTEGLRGWSMLISGLLLLLALVSAAGLVMHAAGVVEPHGSTLSLWYVLFFAGVLGIVGVASLGRAAEPDPRRQAA